MKAALRTAGLLLAALAAGAAAAQQSETFSMERVTVTNAASPVGSSGYKGSLLLSQGTPAGAASFCNNGFVASFGYWSVMGDLPVPIVLRFERDPIRSHATRLKWTGADDEFQIYRSTDPQDVISAPHLNAEVATCEMGDADVPAALFFYKIVRKRSN